MIKRIVLVLVCFNLALYAKTITIAAGQDVGNYYKIAVKIKNRLPGYDVKILKTAGTIENMMLLSEKKADIALAQEDAKELTNTMFAKENKTVNDFAKAVGVLYKEKLHVIVNKKSKYKTIEDLDGAIASTGGKSSGTSVTASYIESSHNINFKKMVDKSIKKSLEMLKKNQLDVVFVVTKSPFKLLNSYDNIRLLPIDNKKIRNKLLNQDLLRKSQYAFLDKNIEAVSINSFIMAHKSLSDKKVMRVLKSMSTPVQVTSKAVKKVKPLIYLDKQVLTEFSIRYGYRGLVRYELYTEMVQKAQTQKTAQKFVLVNNFFNRINYMKDIDVWGKEDYWATPLQVLGTSAADSEDYALSKYFTLIKLGVDEKQLKLIHYNDGDDGRIVLVYKFRKNPNSVVLDYKKNKIKKLNSQHMIKEVTNVDDTSSWSMLFMNDKNSVDLNEALEKIISTY